ncbi:MAG: hypothetical protein RIR48_2 [Bacteroidota bacterium]|jgi:hypothetical protein
MMTEWSVLDKTSLESGDTLPLNNERTATSGLQLRKVGFKLKICKIFDRSYKLRPS